MEKRILKVSTSKSGGTASKGSVTHRITLPNKWMRELNVTPDDRSFEMSFDGKTITLRKIEQ